MELCSHTPLWFLRCTTRKQTKTRGALLPHTPLAPPACDMQSRKNHAELCSHTPLWLLRHATCKADKPTWSSAPTLPSGSSGARHAKHTNPRGALLPHSPLAPPVRDDSRLLPSSASGAHEAAMLLPKLVLPKLVLSKLTSLPPRFSRPRKPKVEKLKS